MKNSVNKTVQKVAKDIKKRLWLVLIAATVPFLIIVIAYILQAETDAQLLFGLAIFILAFGLALLASKVATHTAVVQYLQAIEELDKAKSDFVSIASHQLKTPVSALQFSTETMQTAIAQENWDQVQIFAQDIHSSANRLNKLTHDLLRVARIENNTYSSNPKQIQIVSEVEKIVAELDEIGKEKNVNLTTNYEIEKERIVTIDPSLFYNVVQNLLTNAFEYAPEGTTISIDITSTNRIPIISISNKTAKKVSDEELDSLFAKFHRGDTGKEANATGSGLGLYIARSYVEQWEGTISAKTKDDLITFQFTLPPA